MTHASRDRSPWVRRTVGATAALGAACVAYGSLWERRWYRRRDLDLPGGARRPGTFLRVLHLSDLHLDPPQEHAGAFLAGLADVRADLVAITGDLLGAQGAEEVTAELLATLTADGTPGVVVLGSNDVFGPTPKGYHRYFTDPHARLHGERLDTPRLIAALERGGYRVLRNGTEVVDTRHGPVVVGGLNDPHLEDTVLPSPSRVRAPDVEGAVAHVGLVHAPYRAALDLLADAGYDVLLAGHTHGGQVRLPGVGALVGNCDLPLSQVRGASRYQAPGREVWLHVSPGLGTSRYAPFRFACRPEATVLHLTP